MALAVAVAIRTHPRLNEKRVTVHDEGGNMAAAGALVTLDFTDWCLCRRAWNDLDADCDWTWAECLEVFRTSRRVEQERAEQPPPCSRLVTIR